MIATIPLPAIDDPVDAAFWSACRNKQLRYQSCLDCGHIQHPPRAMCPKCQGMNLGWVDASGTGEIWSFTLPKPPLLPAFDDILPYCVAIITPEDFPVIRIVGAMVARDGSNLGGLDVNTIHIGMPVSVNFIPVSEDAVLPCWSPIDPAHTPQIKDITK